METRTMRAKRTTLMVAALASVLAGSPQAASAGIIYTTFGAGGSFNQSEGNGVGSDQYSPFSSAMGFTVSGGDFTLTSISVAAYVYAGPATLQAVLLTSNGGIPDSPLETFEFTNVPSSPATILSAASSLHPDLVAGQEYWLALEAPTRGTEAAWQLSSPVVTGPAAASYSAALNINQVHPESAYQLG